MKAKYSKAYIIFMTVFSLLFFVNKLDAVLVKMKHFTTENKNFYIFFEKHYFMNNEDIEQVKALDQFLAKYNLAAKNPIQIYVEVPGTYKSVYSGGKVTRCIMDIASKYKRNIMVHDVEIRAKSALALVMLSSFYCPFFSNDNYLVAGKSIDIKSMTFEDIFEELDEKASLAKDLGKYLSKDLVFKKWVSIGRARLSLSNYIKKIGIDYTRCLTKYVKSLDFDKKNKLQRRVSDLFSVLFDLHLTYKIKSAMEQPSHSSDFAFIVGSEHAQWICKVLTTTCNAKLIQNIKSRSPRKIFSIFNT